MTPEQKSLLRDKLSVWRSVADNGPMDLRDYNRRAVHALEALFDQAEVAQSRAQRTAEALKGMLGLCQLLLGRDDLPAAVREALISNHRVVDAKATLTVGKSLLVPDADWLRRKVEADPDGLDVEAGSLGAKGGE